MYSVAGYGAMIADTARLAAHRQALRQTVRPGSVVVDLGAGTGVFSLEACRLGAARVYAIETNPAIALARDAAVVNGFQDRLIVIEEMSTKVELPEQADVLLSDLRGVLPLFTEHIRSIVDARQRFLKPTGVQIPAYDELWIAPARHPDAHRELTEPWEALDDLEMPAGRTYAVNSMLQRRTDASDLVGEPRRWATLDYRSIEDPNVTGSALWAIEERLLVNGFSMWFSATLVDGVSYATSPFVPERVHGMAFCPLESELELEQGDELGVTVRADLVAGSYVWTWTTQVESGQGVQRMRQSTFLSQPPPSPEELTRRAANFRPTAGVAAGIDRLAIELMDGERTLEDIAARLIEAFPDDFSSQSQALARAADLSVEYARNPFEQRS